MLLSFSPSFLFPIYPGGNLHSLHCNSFSYSVIAQPFYQNSLFNMAKPNYQIYPMNILFFWNLL